MPHQMTPALAACHCEQVENVVVCIYLVQKNHQQSARKQTNCKIGQIGNSQIGKCQKHKDRIVDLQME